MQDAAPRPQLGAWWQPPVDCQAQERERGEFRATHRWTYRLETQRPRLGLEEEGMRAQSASKARWSWRGGFPETLIGDRPNTGGSATATEADVDADMRSGIRYVAKLLNSGGMRAESAPDRANFRPRSPRFGRSRVDSGRNGGEIIPRAQSRGLGQHRPSPTKP